MLGAGRIGPRGMWEGNLYLRGGGDPTFGSSDFIRSRYGGLGTSVTVLVSNSPATTSVTSPVAPSHVSSDSAGR